MVATQHDNNMVATQHDNNMVATQHDNNMVATQQNKIVAAKNMIEILLGTDTSTKVNKVETTIHNVKQPQLSVSVSMIEYLNEEIEIKLSRSSICCSSFQSLAAAN